MAHETEIRLPARLTGVVRTDGPTPVGAPLLKTVAVPVAVAAASAPPQVAAPPAFAAADRERLQQVLAGLQESVVALRRQQRHLARALEPLAVELALAVAERFLRAKIDAGEFPMTGLIQQAIMRLEVEQPLVVMLHPADLAALQRLAREDWLAGVVSEVRLTADAAMKRGSCRVQAQDRAMSFDWENRLAALRQQLLDAVAESAESR